MTHRILCTAVAITAALAGCARTGTRMTPPDAASTPPAARPPQTTEDAPEISRSRGAEGGLVILWPRVIDPTGGAGSSREIAAAIQERLRAAASQAFPGRALDVRPEPERVCPQAGCLGIAVGALLVRQENGCAVVALLSEPGPSPERLVRWAGEMRLTTSTVPFRDPPENSVRVSDFTPCGDLLPELDANLQVVSDAMQAMAR